MCSSPDSHQNIIKLNIGGAKFETTRSTLSKYDSLLKTMLETDVPILHDDTGSIFIDRSPAHFSLILDFLRDEDSVKQSIASRPLEDVKRILNDVEFYLLENTMLAKWCAERLEEPEVRVVRNEAELFKLTMESEKDVIVYRFSVDPGVILLPFPRYEVRQLLLKVQDRFDVVFMPCDQIIEKGFIRDVYPKTGWKLLGRNNEACKYNPLCLQFEEKVLADWPRLKKDYGFV